jgi:Mrp family chromosome partitioning ATPase
VGLVTDAAILSALVNGAIMVLDAQFGDRNLAIKSKEQVNANIIGIILNNVRQEKSLYILSPQLLPKR